MAAGCAEPAREALVCQRRPLPVRWHRPTESACVELGDEGQFDSQHLFAPCVIWQAGGFRMFYCGSGPQQGRLFQIGIADSQDGLTWTKRAGGAVLWLTDGRRTFSLRVSPHTGRVSLVDGEARALPADRDDLDA